MVVVEKEEKEGVKEGEELKKKEEEEEISPVSDASVYISRLRLNFVYLFKLFINRLVY